jgi:hypothetical protein
VGIYRPSHRVTFVNDIRRRTLETPATVDWMPIPATKPVFVLMHPDFNF